MDAKRKRIVAVGSVVALAAVALALDQVMSLGFFGQETVEVAPLTGDSPEVAPGVALAPGTDGGAQGVAANASGANPEGTGGEEAAGESEDEETEGEGDGAKAAEVGLSPSLQTDGPEAKELTHTALETMATWEPKAGSYPEGSLLGYLTHRKLWVAGSALAFAVETGAYSEKFLRERGIDIRTRFGGPGAIRFVRRFQASKPDVHAKLLILMAPMPASEAPVKEEAPAKEAPVKEAPANEAPANEAPVKEASEK